MKFLPSLVVPSLVVAAFSAVLACSGCSPMMTVSGATLTSGANMSQGKRSPAAVFHQDDTVVMLVDLTWPDPENDGGRHRCDWRWYRGDQLVSRSQTKDIDFRSTPFTLRTARAAATLGAGHFKVETMVDGVLVATSRFDILT